MATPGTVLVLWLALAGIRADQVEMQNGDRYLGKVLSLTTDKLVIQSDVLGKLTLPRDKVALIALGTILKTNAASVSPLAPEPVNAPAVALTNSNSDIAGALRGLGSDPKTIERIRGQFLAGAGADANQKFDEMLGGLASGKLNLDSIRSEADSAATRLRAMKKELGPDAGEALDAYLVILDNFLKETTPSAGSVPGAAGAQPGRKP
jgi:hypothetical protein